VTKQSASFWNRRKLELILYKPQDYSLSCVPKFGELSSLISLALFDDAISFFILFEFRPHFEREKQYHADACYIIMTPAVQEYF
jgi:hypothetical protein